MKQIHYNAIISSPIGKLGIKTDAEFLQVIAYLPEQARESKPDNEISRHVIQQLQAYFKNPKFEFDIPRDMRGTDFQQCVWKNLEKIAFGTSMTYSELAQKISSGARAVGNACRKNPIPIIVPCHRVISKTGIGGYDGDWGEGKVDIKQWLLKHEGTM